MLTWSEYKEIVKSNTEVLRRNKWWKPALVSCLAAIILNIISIIWMANEQKKLDKLEAELEEVESC